MTMASHRAGREGKVANKSEANGTRSLDAISKIKDVKCRDALEWGTSQSMPGIVVMDIRRTAHQQNSGASK